MKARYIILVVAFATLSAARAQGPNVATEPSNPRLEALKKEVPTKVDQYAKFAQEMVDSVFSFGELGFQEIETSKYLTAILEKHGFKVERGFSGLPTAWVARFGSGKPVIALGSDLDCIPKASQKPGVAYESPLVEGAPGHGEGHNTGVPLNIVSALVLKDMMLREKLSGTLVLWPGVAEELLASKAWFVRDGMFKDVDLSFFVHVGSNLETGYGLQNNTTGMVSIEYTFEGQAAHAAGGPWKGRSALDAVELMAAGWNYRREHLPIRQRSHYIITNGGDQPNVVPKLASIWFYLREIDKAGIQNMWDTANKMADGASLMTDTKWTSRIVGAAYPQHFNKVLAEAMDANIRVVGLPKWSDDDQTLARALQKELGNKEVKGLASELKPFALPIKPEDNRGGGSDDIGDISWTLPTVRLRFPSNIPDLPGHHWADAVASATPIAHKGVIAGAKVQAMTILDFLLTPGLTEKAWAYFRDVQTKDEKYVPFIQKDTPLPVWMNKETMDTYRAKTKQYYYDPSKYTTYLQQLGIKYPTLKPDSKH